MRRYLFAYSFILFASQLYINFWYDTVILHCTVLYIYRNLRCRKTSLEIVRYDNISHSEQRGSPLCCCKPSDQLRSLSAGLSEVYCSQLSIHTLIYRIIRRIWTHHEQICGIVSHFSLRPFSVLS